MRNGPCRALGRVLLPSLRSSRPRVAPPRRRSSRRPGPNITTRDMEPAGLGVDQPSPRRACSPVTFSPFHAKLVAMVNLSQETETLARRLADAQRVTIEAAIRRALEASAQPPASCRNLAGRMTDPRGRRHASRTDGSRSCAKSRPCRFSTGVPARDHGRHQRSMIVVDSSALIAILFAEPEKPAFQNIIAGGDRCVISAVNAHETATVLRLRHGAGGRRTAVAIAGGQRDRNCPVRRGCRYARRQSRSTATAKASIQRRSSTLPIVRPMRWPKP